MGKRLKINHINRIEMEGKDNFGQAPVFSKVVRAGKRTYFFDVKQTKGKENYLTITESKKRFKDNGEFYYEKHKLFLYKEDFDKFSEGLTEALDKTAELNSDLPQPEESTSTTAATYSDKIDNITRGTDDEVKLEPITEEHNAQE